MPPPTTLAPRPLPARPVLPPRTVAPPRPGHQAPVRSRPDPTGHRLAIGFGALAAASALATAFLAPATAAVPAASTTAPAVAPDAVPVQHVVQYVQLQPGQTPPPNATVSQAAPAPTPRVVVVTTRQSGTKR